MTVIEFSNISKIYHRRRDPTNRSERIRSWVIPLKREIKALDQVNFKIDEGEMIGYLGPNGAGKTTTLKIITGILTPNSGTASVLGLNPNRNRYDLSKKYGIIFGQKKSLWPHIPVIESLKLYRDIYELERDQFERNLEFLIEILDIRDLLEGPPRKMSSGQQRRCEIAACLIHRPKLILLDEPTLGVDVLAKRKIHEALHIMNKEEETTIFLTTHDTTDIERVCNRVLILDKGSVIHDGDLDILARSRLPHKNVVISFRESVSSEKIKNFFNPIAFDEKDGQISMKVPKDVDLPDALKKLMRSVDIEDLMISDPNLEEIIASIYTES